MSTVVAAASALDVDGLTVDVHTPAGPMRAVSEVAFSVRRGETLALLGESGCGKSMTAQAIAGLLDPVAEVTGGTVRLAGKEVLGLDRRERRRLAGTELSIVFQDAMASLNPVQSVGAQIAEPFRIHEGISRRAARERAVELMERVGFPEPAARARAHPHELSGGMRQRVLIAMAVSLRPTVLLADEPTTALDVTIQAQIMELLSEMREETQMALLLITHDLTLAAEYADRVAVMYAGRIVETGPVASVLREPRHPYTAGLLRSLPEEVERGGRLSAISGAPPGLGEAPAGCSFRTRCPMARDRCAAEVPPLRAVAPNRASACHFSEELAGD